MGGYHREDYSFITLTAIHQAACPCAHTFKQTAKSYKDQILQKKGRIIELKFSATILFFLITLNITVEQPQYYAHLYNQ